MRKKIESKYKVITLATCIIAVLVVLTVSFAGTFGQQTLNNQTDKNEIIRQVIESPNFPMKVLGNENCPLRITEAVGKEIPGSLFTRLTGLNVNLPVVSSVPEVKMVNISGKTITGFILAIRSPQTKSIRTFSQKSILVRPGESYTIKRDHFLIQSKMQKKDENGQIRQENVFPTVDSPEYWIKFADKPNFFVTVGIVYFDDNSRWMIERGGEVK